MSSQRRKRPPLLARLKAGSLVLVVLLAAAFYGAFRLVTWPGFHVQRIVVTGNARVTTEAIVDAAGVPRHRNLWLISLAPARRRIEALPWIATARLLRLPPATLRISVTERVPAAVLAVAEPSGAHAAFALVDAAGRVLERSAHRAWPYPLVQGVELGDPRFPRLVADLRTLADAHLDVRELDVTPLGDLVAVTYTRLRLDLGSDADLARKASLVQPIVARLGPRVSHVAALDLRAPSTPVIVYR